MSRLIRIRFVYRRPERFRLGSYRQDNDLSDLRWTVDEPADLELATRIYSELYPINPDFATNDVLDLLSAHPELAAINAHHRRNEGLTRTPAADGALGKAEGAL